MNSRRFLSLDLNYGRRVDSEMYEYLFDNGMTREEYHFFLGNRIKQHCILGNDYYWTNEHRVSADGTSVASGEVFGYSEITRQYYDRYRLPVMHTETNLIEGPNGDEAVHWLWKEWANVLRLRNEGIPTVGFTWYSLTDQVDWDCALREKRGTVNPLGLYDLDRNIRAVGRAYKQLIRDWRDVLPASSVCLAVPIVPPSHYDIMDERDAERAQRVVGVLPRGEPPGDQARRDHELDAVPVAGPQLRPSGGLGDVRISVRLWDDQGGISFLPRQPHQAALHPRQRLLLDQRASGTGRRHIRRLGRGVRLHRDHAPIL
jgi:hypothetical protein